MRRQANKFGPGVSPSWDANDHVTQIDFSDKFSREMAETWLSEHDYHEFTVEDAEIEEKSRTFGYQFVNLGGKIEHTPEGGLRVKGVKLLAVGTWTDSAQKTACEYSPEVLKQFSSNWIDNAIWSRHFGGVPRNITEKVGIVENQRYENEAVVGDLYYHGLTGQSRDTIAMIDNGLANYVSVETVSKDKWNVGKKVYQAQELGFTGLATVNQGACRVCKIRENEIVEPEKKEDETIREDETLKTSDSLDGLKEKIRSGLKVGSGTTMEGPYIIAIFPDQVVYEQYDGTKPNQYRIPYQIDGETVTFGTAVPVEVVYQDIEPEQKTGAFEEDMEAKEFEEKLEAVRKEFSEKLEAAETVNKELAARLETIEKTPTPPKSAGGIVEESKELESVPMVTFDRKTGVISRRV